MFFLQRIRQFMWYAFTGIFWIQLVAVSLAQEMGEEADGESGQENWILPYALVVLGVGLGILVVCRPSKRKEVETN
ncbi:MAG: hypothetical protein MK179_05375 [Pirellulaceae bacterium]|nr:hypothetical protein [Pirellulaceae bacterium]